MSTQEQQPTPGTDAASPDGDGDPEKPAGRDAFVEAQRVHRLGKLAALREEGIEPYPPHFAVDKNAGALHDEFDSLDAGATTDQAVAVAGRVMLIRRHGGLIFADLRDRTRTVQLLVSQSELGDTEFGRFRSLDLGDWVGAEGTVMKTRMGELSVNVARFDLLSKALRALPSKSKGLTDPDTRFRQRYLDLVVNPQTKRIFEARFNVLASIRRTLSEQGYYEVETPVLDNKAGGASARP